MFASPSSLISLLSAYNTYVVIVCVCDPNWDMDSVWDCLRERKVQSESLQPLYKHELTFSNLKSTSNYALQLMRSRNWKLSGSSQQTSTYEYLGEKKGAIIATMCAEIRSVLQLCSCSPLWLFSNHIARQSNSCLTAIYQNVSLGFWASFF